MYKSANLRTRKMRKFSSVDMTKWIPSFASHSWILFATAFPVQWSMIIGVFAEWKEISCKRDPISPISTPTRAGHWSSVPRKRMDE